MSTYNYNTPPYPPPRGHQHEESDTTTVGGYPANPKDVEEARMVGRTPSPTPSEAKELKSGAIDWKGLANWRFWIRKEWWLYYIIFVVIITLSILMTIFHKQIVDWLTPATKWMHDLKFGWLIPIGVLFVISFPPLFGHEIVAILCGVVWGLGPGFGIVAAGTFLGEVGNFYAFKYLCRTRSEKAERTSIFYACLAQVVREGGFKIALIARLSAIPGHFTTGIFATCGMGIITFSIAAILSLPKQLVTVYLGVLLEQSSEGVTDKKSQIISDAVVVLTTLITFIAMWYILREMNKVKPDVIYRRRKARQAKLSRAYSSDSESTLAVHQSAPGVFNPMASQSDIPLQQWDASGRAVGYAQDPNLYAPVPKRVSYVPAMGARVRESTEEVGWELGSEGRSVGASPRMASPRQQQQQHQYQPGRFSNELDQPTPTQASFAAASSSSPPVSPRKYPNPFDRQGEAAEYYGQRTTVDDNLNHIYGAPSAGRTASPGRPAYAAYRTTSPVGLGAVNHRGSYHESDLR